MPQKRRQEKDPNMILDSQQITREDKNKKKKEFLKEIKKNIITNKMALRTYICIIILNINGIY